MSSNHCRAHVCAYLILEKDNEVLLSLRQGTGFADGQWNLPAGHVEEGETVTQAICREALEEIGVTIDPKDLEVVHIMYHMSNRPNVVVCMRCGRWLGDICNVEPHKCGGLQFFRRDTLPDQTPDYIKHLFKLIAGNKFYSEYGW